MGSLEEKVRILEEKVRTLENKVFPQKTTYSWPTLSYPFKTRRNLDGQLENDGYLINKANIETNRSQENMTRAKERAENLISPVSYSEPTVVRSDSFGGRKRTRRRKSRRS